MNKEKGIVNWLETLPFPLASILRRYHADHDSRSKNDHLLFFFEAFAQFVTTVMFSALKNDEVLFEKQRTSWIKDKLADRLKMSSFGIWGILGEQLAKITRRELSSKDSRDRCLRMYRVKRSDFLDTITNKKIYEIISTTAGYRNNWKGHGGIVGEKEQKNRQTLLENELSKIREIISDCFEDSIFLRPKDNTYSKGVYNYVIMSLMGSHTTFKEEEIRTIIPLDISKNYILFEDNPEPLELIPFVKFMSTPESEETACYFYNRIEKNKIRWVSYHFEKESEIMSEDKALTAFISNFENQDNKSR